MRSNTGLRGEYEDSLFEHDCLENTDSDDGIHWECSSCGRPVPNQDQNPLTIIRTSKQDGEQEVTDNERAIRLLADVYGSADEVIDLLRSGHKLQTDFAYYEAKS